MSETLPIFLEFSTKQGHLDITLSGQINLQTLGFIQKEINKHLLGISKIDMIIEDGTYADTAGSIYLNNLKATYALKKTVFTLTCKDKKLSNTLLNIKPIKAQLPLEPKLSLLEYLGEDAYMRYKKLLEFLSFFGQIAYAFFHVLKNPKLFRYKEVFFEINENAIKAFYIVALTSFLVGIVTAFQSATQLKLYGANIFVVDMLGISILRELAPLLTAIIIAGRSGSSFTAQIGAMKITEELDAMRTMGFDPMIFLVLPRIIGLMIMMPLMIFLADISGLIGGMLVAHLDLDIPGSLFLDRFSEVVAIKHFYVGIFKGPFFAFLIASIGIFRGMMVKDDTQSIGINTTKSVVESIFTVIVCDAVFSVIFTNMGI